MKIQNKKTKTITRFFSLIILLVFTNYMYRRFGYEPLVVALLTVIWWKTRCLNNINSD